MLGLALKHLRPPSDPRLLVGIDTSDDAAVFKLSDELALVQTVDFFTPIVDDPYWFGRIAAANALSDVYAMGGEPLTALNIVCFPEKTLDIEVLEKILEGGQDAVTEAGALIVGGHTVSDPEPKYGLAVTGTIHPDAVITNAGARPGDVLILTKPIGTGILCTAHKQGRLPDKDLEHVIRVMATLNRAAGRAMRRLDVIGATDITGFGLAGHTLELARASRVTIEIDASRVPFLEGTLEYAQADVVPGGARKNLEFAAPFTSFASTIVPHFRLALCDAQTSGGLLVAVPERHRDDIRVALEAEGVDFYAEIGRVLPQGEYPLTFVDK